MKIEMAYIATDPNTGECFAIHSANPDHMDGFEKELKSWKRSGAIVELLPVDDAKNRFIEGTKPKDNGNQLELFK
jgi:hypothetical protein